MRLKEDSSSWKSNGIKHRDNRHDKSTEEVPRHRSKKDKKRWCGGRVGKKHEIAYRECVKWNNRQWRRRRPPIMELACVECNKVFDIDFGWFGRPKRGREALLEEWKKKLDL